MLIVFTDGSSSGKSNLPGGWGYLIVRDEEVLHSDFGGDVSTTNNLQELRAAFEGLEAVARLGLRRPGEEVILASDSQYTIGFITGVYRAKVNQDYTIRLRNAADALEAGTRWVRGHAMRQGVPFEDHELDIRMNVSADRLAKAGKQMVLELLENHSPDIVNKLLNPETTRPNAE